MRHRIKQSVGKIRLKRNIRDTIPVIDSRQQGFPFAEAVVWYSDGELQQVFPGISSSRNALSF